MNDLMKLNLPYMSSSKMKTYADDLLRLGAHDVSVMLNDRINSAIRYGDYKQAGRLIRTIQRAIEFYDRHTSKRGHKKKS